jgi:hypothetical protein
LFLYDAGMTFQKVVTRILLLLILVPALGFALWAWATLSFSYSKGERSGFLQKFSEKGWICKTWEGELAVTTFPGSTPEIFYFTVRDPKVVPEIQSRLGQRVSLAYAEHRFVPTSCFGETAYFASGARTIDAVPLLTTTQPAVPVAAPVNAR